MMKRILFLLVLLSTSLLMAQKSTQRKVILENFTTAACPNCPPIHTFLENYVENEPNAILIAQHAGYGTDPMTIPENTQLLALYNDGGSTYAPALAIDRFHYDRGLTGGPADPGPVFWPGESTANTTTRIDERLAIPSNISLDISYVNNSGVLDIDVEGEILETVSGSDLRLLVYIKEDGIISPQSGGSSNYVHNNVMRDAISGTWGDAGIITSNTAGTTFSTQYNYTLDTSWIVDNLTLVAFVANYDSGNVNNREILQADAIPLTAPIGVNNAAILSIEEIKPTCDLLISPELIVKNYGSTDITSFTLDYSINGGNTTGTFNWSGDPISLFDTQIITIDDIPFNELNEVNPIDFEITEVNGVSDDDPSNNSLSSSFNRAPISYDDNVQLVINTDGAGGEFSWEIKDYNDNVVESGSSYGNSQTYIENYVLNFDCHTIHVYDSGGNGGTSLILADSQSDVLFYTDGSFGAYDFQEFTVADFQSVEDLAFKDVNIFPNPAQDNLTILNAEGLNVAIFDVMGRKVVEKLTLSAQENIQLSKVAEGTYFVHLTDGQDVRVEKIVIRR